MASFIKFGGWAVSLALLTLLVAVAAAVAFGGPAQIAPLDSVNQPFVGLRMDDLPALSRYASRDGQRLAYRHYPAQSATASAGRVVLVHGSSASSQSMHPLATAL
ncbi:MAG: hypothetical protein RLZZ401_1080, partial [Pseudomonadota bacterium]